MQFEYKEINLDGVGRFLLAFAKGKNDAFLDAIKHPGFLVVKGNDSAYHYAFENTRPGGSFIDIGANIGTFTIPIASKGVDTMAVEVLPENFLVLCEAVRINNLTNVTPVHAAAYDGSKIVRVFGDSAWGEIIQSGRQHHSLYDVEATFPAPGISVDHLIDIYGFSGIDLIKIDVEGAELKVLSGMTNTLSRDKKPDIIFEGNELTSVHNKYTSKNLIKLLSDFGYNIFQFSGLNLVPVLDDYFQYLLTVDYLATEKGPEDDFGSFSIRPLEKPEIIQQMVAQMYENSFFYKAHFLARVKASSDFFSDSEEIKEAIRTIEKNKTSEIIKWTKIFEQEFKRL